MAALAGTWIALVCGFGGLRDHGGQPSFAPRLPRQLSRLSFTVRWRSSKIRVVATVGRVTYALEGGSDTALELLHHGTALVLSRGVPVQLAVPPLEPPTDVPRQPAGRAPVRVDPAPGTAG